MSKSESIAADDAPDRDAILGMLGDMMHTLHQQTMTAEPTTTAAEELQLKRARTLGYLANQHRKLQQDRDLDEMEEELALLQADETAD